MWASMARYMNLKNQPPPHFDLLSLAIGSTWYNTYDIYILDRSTHTILFSICHYFLVRIRVALTVSLVGPSVVDHQLIASWLSRKSPRRLQNLKVEAVLPPPHGVADYAVWRLQKFTKVCLRYFIVHQVTDIPRRLRRSPEPLDSLMSPARRTVRDRHQGPDFGTVQGVWDGPGSLGQFFWNDSCFKILISWSLINILSVSPRSIMILHAILFKGKFIIVPSGNWQIFWHVGHTTSFT